MEEDDDDFIYGGEASESVPAQPQSAIVFDASEPLSGDIPTQEALQNGEGEEVNQDEEIVEEEGEEEDEESDIEIIVDPEERNKLMGRDFRLAPGVIAEGLAKQIRPLDNRLETVQQVLDPHQLQPLGPPRPVQELHILPRNIHPLHAERLYLQKLLFLRKHLCKRRRLEVNPVLQLLPCLDKIHCPCHQLQLHHHILPLIPQNLA
ncbi:hypothetical protein JB92DRAFT_1812548 [Gautieria morchelliformis]|nr:hypothetical protein JB92DRAFT_1812548 [Gautieria morchelliformis]